MATVVATSSGGTLSYLTRDPEAWEKLRNASIDNFPSTVGGVDVLTAGCVACTASITAILGAKISKRLSGRTLKIIQSCFMLTNVPMILFREKLKGMEKIKAETKANSVGASLFEQAPRPLAIGAISGVAAGLLGVGGGLITVPALCMLTDLSYQTALGTSLAGK
jgi:hypothetical protein